MISRHQEKAVDRLYHILHQYNDDKDNLVRDVLSDLRHYCDNRGLDFAQEDGVAHRNYLAELEEDQSANRTKEAVAALLRTPGPWKVSSDVVK